MSRKQHIFLFFSKLVIRINLKPSETSRPTFQTDETLYETYFWWNGFPLGAMTQCENFSGQSDANNPTTDPVFALGNIVYSVHV